jgi:hypothetical protein
MTADQLIYLRQWQWPFSPAADDEKIKAREAIMKSRELDREEALAKALASPFSTTNISERELAELRRAFLG